MCVCVMIANDVDIAEVAGAFKKENRGKGGGGIPGV